MWLDQLFCKKQPGGDLPLPLVSTRDQNRDGDDDGDFGRSKHIITKLIGTNDENQQLVQHAASLYRNSVAD